MLIHPSFCDHWKTKTLKARLGQEAVECLLRLWGHCQNGKTDIIQDDPYVLKAITNYSKSEDEIYTAMIACGFLAKEEQGLKVCGFAEHNATLFNSWDNGRFGGRPKKEKKQQEKTHGIPTGYPRDTHGGGPWATHGGAD